MTRANTDAQWRALRLVGALALACAGTYWVVGVTTASYVATISVAVLMVVGFIAGTGLIARRYRIRGKLIIHLTLWAFATILSAWVLGAIIVWVLFWGPGPPS